MDILVEPASDAVAVSHEPILGPVDRRDKFGFDARFLSNFAQRRLFLGLSVVDHALRQLPPMFGMGQDDGGLYSPDNLAVSPAPCRHLLERNRFFAGVFHRSLLTACSTARSSSALI